MQNTPRNHTFKRIHKSPLTPGIYRSKKPEKTASLGWGEVKKRDFDKMVFAHRFTIKSYIYGMKLMSVCWLVRSGAKFKFSATDIFIERAKWQQVLMMKAWFFSPETFPGNGFSQKDVDFTYISLRDNICILVAYSPYTDVAPEKPLKCRITFAPMIFFSPDLFRKWFWTILRRSPPLTWPDSISIIVTYSPYTALSPELIWGAMVFHAFRTPIFVPVASSTQETLIHPFSPP